MYNIPENNDEKIFVGKKGKHSMSDIAKRFANDIEQYENQGVPINVLINLVSRGDCIECRTVSQSPEQTVSVLLVGLINFIKSNTIDTENATKMLGYVVNDLMQITTRWANESGLTMQDIGDNIDKHPYKFIS